MTKHATSEAAGFSAPELPGLRRARAASPMGEGGSKAWSNGNDSFPPAHSRSARFLESPLEIFA